MTSKYDDATWHSDGDFPADLPPEAGAIHIGMFVCWIIHRDLIGEDLRADASESIEAVKACELTGAQFLLLECDGKLLSDDPNDKGNAFAAFYYGLGGEAGEYFDDYMAAVSVDEETLYNVADSWENYDHVAQRCDAAYAKWQLKNAH